MTIEDMRYELMQEYPTEKWRIKCLYMSDQQVFAIHRSIRNRKKRKPTQSKKDPGFEQIKFDLGSLM